jgi:PIN domain nuclease of toxin-antitoxin system
VLVSEISYGEVAVKAARGKLTLFVDVAIWLQQAEQPPGIRFRALDRPVLPLSTRLPGSIHNDPADRMLISRARRYPAAGSRRVRCTYGGVPHATMSQPEEPRSDA